MYYLQELQTINELIEDGQLTTDCSLNKNFINLSLIHQYNTVLNIQNIVSDHNPPLHTMSLLIDVCHEIVKNLTGVIHVRHLSNIDEMIYHYGQDFTKPFLPDEYKRILDYQRKNNIPKLIHRQARIEDFELIVNYFINKIEIQWQKTNLFNLYKIKEFLNLQHHLEQTLNKEQLLYLIRDFFMMFLEKFKIDLIQTFMKERDFIT